MKPDALVREWRRRAGFTQAQLAERVGILRPALARIETGRVSPSAVLVDRILRACGASLLAERLPIARADDPETARLSSLQPLERLIATKRPGFDPQRALRYLVGRHVDFVVIGDAAARVHGAPVEPGTVEVCARPGERDDRRLAAVMEALDRPLGTMLATNLVVLREAPPPLPSFDALARAAVSVELDDEPEPTSFAVAALDDLILVAAHGDRVEQLRALREGIDR